MTNYHLKHCFKCGEEKPIWEFPKNYKMQSGRDIRCHDCVIKHWARFRSHTKC